MELGTIITIAWLVAGLLIIGSELFLPGLVAVFLGAAAVVVAGARWLGLVEGLGASFAVWLLSSTLLILGLRGMARRLLPAETSRQEIDEAITAYGTEVEVVKTVTEENMEGRIRYQGTSWPAMSADGSIEPGCRARLLYRDKEGIGWVVEPVRALLEEGAGDATAQGDD